MPVSEKINQGGMFRCCVDTLLSFSGETRDGMVIKCGSCRDGKMKLMNGVWCIVFDDERSP